MKQHTAIFLAIVSIAACGSAAVRAAPSTAEPVAFDAREFELAHDGAWNAQDADRMAALFASGGTLVTPSGKRVVGTAALTKTFAAPGPNRQTKSTLRVDAVQWLADGVALIDATQTLSGPGVEKLGADSAKLIAVVRRVEGKWRLAAARPVVSSTR